MSGLFDFGQGLSREAWAGGLGAPADLATLLANLGIAGGGYLGHKAGLLARPPDLLPPSPMGSEAIAQRMRGAGLLADNPGSTGDTLATMLSPALGVAGAAAAPKMAGLLNTASRNLEAPRTMHPQAGMIDLENIGDMMKAPEGQATGANLSGAGGKINPISLEAANRLAAEMAAGQHRIAVDKYQRVRHLNNPADVDAAAQAGEVIMQRGIGKEPNGWTELSRGADVKGSALARALAAAKAWQLP
jgi:hypothetical protein